jgi:CRISPR-associated protein Csb2
MLGSTARPDRAAIEFDRDIAGPVLIGAGRFRGYGLMRPWQQGEIQ